MMYGAFSVIPLLLLLLYIALIVFTIWWAIKFLFVQMDRNKILKDIASKMDKKDE